MEKILCVLALLACCANAKSIQNDGQKTENVMDRITGGGLAVDSQFPYAISLQQVSLLPNHLQAHRCGGALFTLQHVLTAATCTYNYVNGVVTPILAAQYRVYAGGALLSADTVADRVKAIANYTVHPEHLIYPALLNDIAIITLVSPYLNVTVVPIPLPTNNFVPADYTRCSLAGWGAPDTSVAASNQLRYTSKYIYNQNLCTSIFNTLAGIANIHPSMICAASYDITSNGCTGDEGNALICDGQLVGVLSLTNRCVATSYPEMYTRVSNYTTWIRSISAASSFKPEMGLFALVAIICLKIFS